MYLKRTNIVLPMEIIGVNNREVLNPEKLN